MKHFLMMIGTILLLLGCVQPAADTSNQSSPVDSSGRSENIFTLFAHHNGISLPQARAFWAEKYGIKEEKEIYAQLPPMPGTMKEELKKLYGGKSEEVGSIPREAYIQPEFYPTYETKGKEKWITAGETTQSRGGIGSIPAEQEAIIQQGENVLKTVLFITSAWGSTEYQGVGFRYRVTPEAPIKVNFEPTHLMLGPTFPRFTPEWAQRMEIQLEVGEGVEAGKYTISIYTDDPTPRMREEWGATYPEYVSGNTGIQPAEGIATFTLNVESK